MSEPSASADPNANLPSLLKRASAEDRERIVNSFLRMRKAVGWLGIILAPGVALGLLVLHALGWTSEGTQFELLPTISDYYHSDTRGLFVGVLCTIAVFLFAYQGYARKPHETLSDDTVANFAGVFALGVAFFPTTPDGEPTTLVGLLHLGSAACLFGCFILFATVIFTRRGADAQWVDDKLPARSRIYMGCGVVMICAIGGIGLYKLLLADAPALAWLARLRPVFFLELAALWAFAVAWLAKGESLRFLTKFAEWVPPTPIDKVCVAQLKTMQRSADR